MFKLFILIFAGVVFGYVHFMFCRESSKQILRSMPYSINPDKEGGDEITGQRGCKTYYAEEGCFNMDNEEERTKEASYIKGNIVQV